MERISKMWRSGIALLLAICMVVGMCPVTTFATETTEEKTLKYVSLGDSMTNGYGLPGYDHNSGVEDYGEKSYASQFATAIEADHHAQLAMSGIRTEDIHWLLEFDYNDPGQIQAINEFITENDRDVDWNQNKWNQYFDCGDYWTVDQICNHSRTEATFAHIAGISNYKTDTGCTHKKLVEFPETVTDKGTSIESYTKGERVAVIAKYYQEQVADADVISLSVGNGNLGVFGFGRILEAIGFDDGTTYENYDYQDVLRECETEMKNKLITMIEEEIKPVMAAYLPKPELEGVVLYIAASLAMNYAGTLDAILQMNPDVEIILVPVMNTFGDDFARVEGELTIGDLLGLVVDPLNKFIAGLPTYMQVTNHEVYKDAKFYWAEPSQSVECFVATYEHPITNPIIRDRFVESIVGGGSGMIWGLLNGDPDKTDDDMVVTITLADIEEYEAQESDTEKLAYAAQNADEAMSISMYLAFEKAIVLGKDNPVTLDSVFSLGELFEEGAENPFGPIMEDFYERAAADGAAKKDAVNAFLATSVETTLEENVKDLFSQTVNVDVDVTADEIAAVLDGTGTVDTIANNAVESILGAVDNITEDALNAMIRQMAKNDQVTARSYIADMVARAVTAETADRLCTLLVMPETLGTCVADSELKGLLALFARCIIGNGIGAHPSEAGHDTLTAAVTTAYEKKITAEDETDENFAVDPVAKKIVSDLTALGYLTDDQIINIAMVAYEDYKDGSVDLFAIVDAAYDIVLMNKDLDDAQRLEIISIVYNDLKNSEAGYLAAYGSYLDTLEAIIALPELKYVSDEKAFDLVEEIYTLVEDGNFSTDDGRNIIYYIWNTTLDEVATFAMRSTDKTDLQKLEAMAAIMEALAADETVQEDYPQVVAVVELYETLTTEDENGEKLVPDEVLIDLFDDVINVIGATDEDSNFVVDITDPEEVTAAATEIVTDLINNEDIPPENKFAVAGAVKDALKEVGGSDNSEEEPEDDNADEILALTEALHKELKAAGYLTDEQFNEIMDKLTDVLVKVMVNGEELTEEQMKTVADAVYRIVFEREDLTIADKIQIVMIIYSVLDEYGYVDFAYEYGYKYAKTSGYVDTAIGYINTALAAVETATGVVNAYETEYADIKAALIEELTATADTLTAIKALLALDALNTRNGAWTALLSLESQLGIHAENLKDLAVAIGVEIDPYINNVVVAATEFAELIETIAAEAYAWFANGIEEFNAEYAALVEEIGQIADLAHPDLGAAVRKYLTETPADALAILYAHGEDAVTVLMAHAAMASGDIYNIFYALAEVVAENGKDIYDAVAESDEVANIMDLIDDAKADLLDLYNVANKGSIDTDYEKLIDDAQNQLMDLYDLLYNEVKAIVIDLSNGDYSELLGAAWDALMDLIDVADYASEYAIWVGQDVQLMLSEQLLALFANNDEFMQVAFPLFVKNAQYVNNYLYNMVMNLRDQIWNVYQDVREVVCNMITTIRECGEDAWVKIKAKLDALYEIAQDVVGVINKHLDELTELLDKLSPVIDDGLRLTGEAIEILKGVVDDLLDLITELMNNPELLEEVREKFENLYDAVLDLKEALEDLIENGLDASAAKVQVALAAVIDAIEELIGVVSEETAAELNEIVEEIKDYLNDAYINATTADYVKGNNSYYVALGDSTATSESYVELLAAELGVEYNNLAQEDMMVDDLYELLIAEQEEISKADLITIGFGNNDTIMELIDKLLVGDTSEYDWATYVGEDGIPYIEDMLTEVYDYFAEANINLSSMGIKDSPTALTALVEAYAYNRVSYACNLPEVINAINEINPDALVVVVGMYNPLENIVIQVSEDELNLTEYLNYVVDATGVHALAYSMITENSIYVSAPNVETKLEANGTTTLSILDFTREFIRDGGENMKPSADGHEYVKEQILDALNVTEEQTGLWGDADGDGIVDSYDARLILMYEVGAIDASALDLSVCDVDGDCVVDSYDARLVLMYEVGAISAFPVEE